MKYKIAICKIINLGSPCLILGICRYDDDDAFWLKYQYFTCEEYVNYKFTYKPDLEFSMYKSQEECDKHAEGLREMAAGRVKYHGEVVHFESINKDAKVYKDVHDFNFDRAEALELTKDELALLTKELNKDFWAEFDLETWGK